MDRPPNDQDGVVTAFRNGQVTLRSNRREEGFTFSIKEIGYQSVRKGDLVIHAMDGFAGAIGVSDSDGKCSPVYSICLPRKDQEANVHYYAYLLRHMALSGFIQSLSKGIRERSTDFRFNVFADLFLPLPTHQEQRTIADFLDTQTARIDAAIDEQRRLIDLLHERRAALISHAVTKGLDPDVPMSDSGVEWIGEIPVHWQIKQLRHIAESLQTGPFGSQLHSSDYAANGIPVINPSHMQDGHIEPDWETAVDDETFDRLRHHELLVGDIVFARRGELGRCALVTSIETGWLCGTGSLRMRPKLALVYPLFLNRMLSTSGIAEWLSLESVGTTMDNLNTSILARLPLPIPPHGEQHTIAAHLDRETAKIDAAVAEIETSIAHLEEYRAALIAAAVTGKIDVRNAM